MRALTDAPTLHTERASPSVVAPAGALRLSGPMRVHAPLIAVLIAGGALRLYHLSALSLWVDEGLTVAFARLPWSALLTAPGSYGIHPPLYYVLVKAAAALL